MKALDRRATLWRYTYGKFLGGNAAITYGAPRGAPFLCAVAALAVIRAASEHSLHRRFNPLVTTTKFRTKMVSSAARPVRPVASEPFGQALHNFAE